MPGGEWSVASPCQVSSVVVIFVPPKSIGDATTARGCGGGARTRQHSAIGPLGLRHQLCASGYNAKGLSAASFAAEIKAHKRKLYWSGLGWSERRDIVSALHFGNSFIVAESFSARPESGADPRHNRSSSPPTGKGMRRRSWDA
jgi:hypothetical protein